MVNNLQTFAKKFTKSFLSSLCGMGGVKNLQAARADNASTDRLSKQKMALEIFNGNDALTKKLVKKY